METKIYYGMPMSEFYTALYELVERTEMAAKTAEQLISNNDIEVKAKILQSGEHKLHVTQEDHVLDISRCEYILFPREVYYGSFELDKDHTAYIVIPASWVDQEDKKLKNAESS